MKVTAHSTTRLNQRRFILADDWVSRAWPWEAMSRVMVTGTARAAAMPRAVTGPQASSATPTPGRLKTIQTLIHRDQRRSLGAADADMCGFNLRSVRRRGRSLVCTNFSSWVKLFRLHHSVPPRRGCASVLVAAGGLGVVRRVVTGRASGR